MLPFTIGLLVSPFPVVAVVALLVSQGGRVKTLIFEVTWLLVSWLALIALTALFAALGITGQSPPSWVPYVALAIGAALLAVGIVAIRRAVGRKAGTQPQAPGWLKAIDGLALPRISGVATLLIIANPVNLASLVGAGLGMSQYGLPFGEQAVLAAVFVLIGSITVLAPFVIALTQGTDSEHVLHRMRAWMVTHNGALTNVLIFTFALLFIAKGLRGLFG